MLLVQDFMVKTDIAVNVDMPINDLTKFLRRKRIGGIPVMDSSKKICGIVTTTDIFKAMAIIRGLFRGKAMWVSLFLARKKIICVKEIYRHEIISVVPDTPIEKVAEIMMEKDTHTVAVMNKEQTVVFGVIGRHDVTWAIFARPGNDELRGKKNYKISDSMKYMHRYPGERSY